MARKLPRRGGLREGANASRLRLGQALSAALGSFTAELTFFTTERHWAFFTTELTENG